MKKTVWQTVSFRLFKCRIDHLLNTSIEIVYNLKYIHSRPDVTDKEKIVWSIRKMGISAQDRSWIILQASSHFQELLSTVVGSHSSWPEDQCNIHLLAHETCNGNWNPYLNHLERQINELVCGSLDLYHISGSEANIFIRMLRLIVGVLTYRTKLSMTAYLLKVLYTKTHSEYRGLKIASINCYIRYP